MNSPTFALAVWACGAALSLWGCSGRLEPRVAADAAASQAIPDRQAEEARHAGPQTQEPAVAPDAPGDEGLSDLDRPVEELVALQCEHAVPTYQCAECRYETGVVKVADDLFRGGLVQAEPLRARRLAAPLELVGQIAFDERQVAHVSPVVTGLIRKIAVDLGQTVEAGQSLFEVESGELASAQGDWLQAQALRRLAEKGYARQQTLWANRVTSEREYLEAQQAAAAAAVVAETARQLLLRLGSTEAELEALEAQGAGSGAGHYTARAPLAGTVVALGASYGERVEPGTDVVLLSNPARLWVWADLHERQLAEVSAAWRAGPVGATVTVEAFPDAVFRGKVDFVGAAMETASRTVRVRVSLDNPDGHLRPGMFARVRLYLQAERSSLAVPVPALLSDEGREFVFVHYDGEYDIRRPVKAGRTVGDLVEIESGLADGQRVVTAGAFLLKSDVLRSKMGAGCAD